MMLPSNMRINTQTKGFSLVEMLVYIALIMIVASVMMKYVVSLSQIRAKAEAIQETEYQAKVIIDTLDQAFRNAEVVLTGSSVFDSDPGTLALDMVDVAVDPTVFSLTTDNGQLQMNEAGGGETVLTSSDILITDFTVIDLTSSEDVAVIMIQFTLQYNSPSTFVYQYEQSFQTTFSVQVD